MKFRTQQSWAVPHTGKITLRLAAVATACASGLMAMAAGCGGPEQSQHAAASGPFIKPGEFYAGLFGRQQERPPNEGPEMVIDLVKRVVGAGDPHVSAWPDGVQPGSIDWMNDVLIVVQTEAGHRQVAELLTLLDRAGSVKADVKDAVERPEPSSDEAHIRTMLAEPVGATFAKGTAVEDALAKISRSKPGLNIVVDRDIESAGVELGVLAADFPDGRKPLAQALDDILSTAVSYRIGPGYLLVCTREAAWLNMPVGIYGVKIIEDKRKDGDSKRAVAVGLRGFAEDNEDSDSDGGLDCVADLIKRVVSAQSDPRVAPWGDEGGPASIALGPNNVLVVLQTREAQAKIASLLGRLCRKGAFAKVETFSAPESPAVAAVRAQLAERIDLNVRKMPLDKVLAEIGRGMPGATVRVDPRVAEEGHDLATEIVTIELKSVPRDVALGLVLKRELTYRVDVNGITILTREQWQRLVVTAYKITMPAKAKK